ncbi:MAG: hypothetical protein IPP64_11575 [Bacteroidetes bacterium]|nr:hypothetical protein [Bacteroidota bacterium]
MINIKAIVEKIKSSYPQIRVEEKVKINEHFIADYVIIQALTIKAIFIPYKKLPDTLWEKYVSGENSKIVYYYNDKKIYVGEFGVNGARLIELTNIDSIFTPFKNEIAFNQFEILEKHKTIVDLLYGFEHKIIPHCNNGSGLVYLKSELKLLRLIDHNKGGFTHNIRWDEYHEKESLVPSNYGDGTYYNMDGKFEMSLNIKFTPFSDKELVKQDENQLTIKLYAKGVWLHFPDRKDIRKSYESSKPLLLHDYGSLKIYENNSIKNDLNIALDYFRLSNNNRNDTTELHWPSNLKRFEILLKNALSVCEKEGVKSSYFE